MATSDPSVLNDILPELMRRIEDYESARYDRSLNEKINVIHRQDTLTYYNGVLVGLDIAVQAISRAKNKRNPK
jgi:hypothetical protein